MLHIERKANAIGLRVEPSNLKEANTFIDRVHRHHKPVRGCKFVAAAAVGDDVVGVMVVGRPVARRLQDGWTVEVTRLCVLAEPRARNAASILYAAAWWRVVDELAGGGTWSRDSRPRVDDHPLQEKLRWEPVG